MSGVWVETIVLKILLSGISKPLIKVAHSGWPGITKMVSRRKNFLRRSLLAKKRPLARKTSRGEASLEKNGQSPEKPCKAKTLEKIIRNFKSSNRLNPVICVALITRIRRKRHFPLKPSCESAE
jgi:hypothetical protein